MSCFCRWRKIRSRTDVLPRLLVAVLMVDLTAVICAAAQDAPVSRISRDIDALSSFEYPTRINAARMLRRAPAADVVPALDQAIRHHSDQYVRYRALVLLTGFNQPRTSDLMRTLLSSPNDRVREVAYRWFERNPDPGLAPALLAALETEGAEFVRPALLRALAALAHDDVVTRAVLGEIGRGFDFFRSAVIEALGSRRAAYAVEPIGAMAMSDGVLQDDAVLALGRIGSPRAAEILTSLEMSSKSVIPAMHAAQCLIGDRCSGRIERLLQAARDSGARADARRAAVGALGAIAERFEEGRAALIDLARDAKEPIRRDVALALSTVALRQPADTIQWLERLPEGERSLLISLLRDGFESLEEDFTEEQFYTAARAAYWKAAEGSLGRATAATLVERLGF